MQINVSVTDANNIVCEVVPPQQQIVVIDRGVEGNGIVSIVPVTISTFQYLRITYTNGTVQDVGPLTSTAYTATSPITIVGNTISLTTVPIALGGTDATTAAGAIQNLLPSYTGNANKRLGLNSGGTALEWVADGGGTVTSVSGTGSVNGLTLTGTVTSSGSLTLGGTLSNVANSALTNSAITINGTSTSLGGSINVGTVTSIAASGGTTGLTFSGSPITTSGTLTLGGTLAIANGGTGQITANAAFNALAPSQTGNSGKYLTTDGSNTSWATNPLGTVTSVAATVPSFLSISGSPITTSGTLAFGLSGTALPTTSGGTGLTSFTANRVFYASSTSAIGQSANLTFDGTTLTAANFADSSLTSGRVTYATTAGNLTDSANLTFDGTTLTANALTVTNAVTLSGGTANGVAYLNGSKVVTSGSALTFDGAKLVNTSAVSGAIIQSTDTGSTGSFLRMLGDASSGNLINWTTGTSLRFATSADNFGSFAEQMRLTSTGLGIGTSSPAQKLDVNGDARVGNATAGTNRRLSINGVASKASLIAFQESGTDRWLIGNGAASENGNFEIYDATNGNNLVMTRSGNLGLGVTPSAWNSSFNVMQIGGSASVYGRASTGYDQAGLYSNARFASGTNDWRYLVTTTGATGYLQSAGAHYWYTAGSGTAGNAITFTQAMTLDASGNLGVGTTSPAEKLDVYVNSTSNISIKVGNTSGALQLLQGNGAAYLYTASNQPLIFSNNNTERARIDSSGNFGIGTTSPTTLLSLASGTAATLGLSITPSGWNNARHRLTVPSSGDTSVWSFNYSGSAVDFSGYGTSSISVASGVITFGTGTTNTAPSEKARIDSSGNLSLSTNGTSFQWINSGNNVAINATSGALSFYTGTSSYAERARITASGAVGIGTSSPNGILDVLGSPNRFTVNPYYYCAFSTGLNSYTKRLFGGAVVDDYSYIGDMYYNNSGTWITPQTSYAATTYGGGVTTFYGGTGVTANSAFYPVERARITSDGVFYMNRSTTNSYDTNIWVQCDISSWLIVNNHTFSTQYFNVFRYAGTSIGSIIGNGTSTSYNTSSDYRLKENIAPMTGALAKVAQLKPCTYTWKSNGTNGQGFIAHELAEVVPEAVTGEKDALDENGNPDYQAIDTSFLVATLTAAIQELKAEFDAYKASHP
jgi:hypothetical protein